MAKPHLRQLVQLAVVVPLLFPVVQPQHGTVQEREPLKLARLAAAKPTGLLALRLAGGFEQPRHVRHLVGAAGQQRQPAAQHRLVDGRPVPALAQQRQQRRGLAGLLAGLGNHPDLPPAQLLLHERLQPPNEALGTHHRRWQGDALQAHRPAVRQHHQVGATHGLRAC